MLEFGPCSCQHQPRSRNLVSPLSRAQWAQQKILPLVASTPWPTILQPQCSHSGATTAIAHSKLSKTWVSPSFVISNVLSYSLPHSSHLAIKVLHSNCHVDNIFA